MNKLFDIFICLLIFNMFYFVIYATFDSTLSDDVDFYYGKHRKRNRRRKEKGFWRKFFFLDIKSEVKKWHYVCFWINFISFFPMLIGNIIYAIFYPNLENKIVAISNYPSTISTIIFFLSGIVGGALPYSTLYLGRVKSKKPYRKNGRK